MFINPELNLDNPYNINHNHDLYFKYNPNIIIGEGIKRTYQYESLITEQQFHQKRNEFWGIFKCSIQETQIQGDHNVWMILKLILDIDDENAKYVLEEANLILIDNSIQIVQDQVQGNKYKIPIFVINLPIQFSDSQTTTLNNDFEEKNITFKIRSVRWDNDLIMTYNTKDCVQLLINELKIKEKVENVRLFIQGKEMIYKFGNYNINDESIVQVFLS